MTFGESMRALMAERGISLRSLAKSIPADVGYLSKISRDLKRPSKEMAERIDAALDASGELAALAPPGLRIPEPGSLIHATVPTHAKDDDVERRQLLQLAAVLGIESAALAATGEPIRQLLALTVGSEFRDVEDWQLTVSDHLHALRARPPGQVRDGLAVDLLAIQRQLSAGSRGDTVELHRVVAMLAVLYAHALTRLAEHSAALHWWRTARAAADASGDLDLRIVVRCEEAGVGLYGQRDPETVLGLIDRAHTLVNTSRQFWLGDLKGTEAKALALLGRHQEAASALNTFVDLAATEPRSSPIPALWKPDQVHFAGSWVYAHRGDEARADEARNRVLSYGDYQYGANVRLHEALCAVVNGGIDTGARQATEILATLPPERPSQMITETGRKVLRAVPLDDRDRPAVRELAALIFGHTASQLRKTGSSAAVDPRQQIRDFREQALRHHEVGPPEET